jgi:hypothetical protein
MEKTMANDNLHWIVTQLQKTNATVLAELKNHASPDLLKELLNPKPVKHDKYPNVTVVYPSFLLWLVVYDPGAKYRGWEVNIRSYIYQRDDHAKQVIDQLTAIWTQRTGKALQVEIARNHFSLKITPYWVHHLGIDLSSGSFDPDPDFSFNSQPVADDWAGATPQGKPVLDADGNPQKIVGTQAGSGVFLYYSPWLYGPNGTAHKTGPGTDPDESLYHELVHCSRLMKGVFYASGVDSNYDNAEEYLAIVLANIYMSEKWKPKLRNDHHTHSVLEHPEQFLDNYQSVSLSPRSLLDIFKRTQPEFFDALAQIEPRPGQFNFVWQYDQELKHGPAGK